MSNITGPNWRTSNGALQSDLLPATNNTLDLGSPAKRFKSAYFAANLSGPTYSRAVDDIVSNTGGAAAAGNIPVYSSTTGKVISDSKISLSDLATQEFVASNYEPIGGEGGGVSARGFWTGMDYGSSTLQPEKNPFDLITPQTLTAENFPDGAVLRVHVSGTIKRSGVDETPFTITAYLDEQVFHTIDVPLDQTELYECYSLDMHIVNRSGGLFGVEHIMSRAGRGPLMNTTFVEEVPSGTHILSLQGQWGAGSSTTSEFVQSSRFVLLYPLSQ